MNLAQLLNGVALGALLMILSSGLAMIYGLRGVMNFSHGALYMLGAYLAYAVTTKTSFWMALIIQLSLAYWIRAFPVSGTSDPLIADYGGRWQVFTDHVSHLMLPLLTLTLIKINALARRSKHDVSHDARRVPEAKVCLQSFTIDLLIGCEGSCDW